MSTGWIIFREIHLKARVISRNLFSRCCCILSVTLQLTNYLAEISFKNNKIHFFSRPSKRQRETTSGNDFPRTLLSERVLSLSNCQRSEMSMTREEEEEFNPNTSSRLFKVDIENF